MLRVFLKELENKEEKILDSSGASRVYFYKNSENVYQVYNDKSIADMIANFMVHLVEEKSISTKIILRKSFGRPKKDNDDKYEKTINIKPFEYIAPFNFYVNNLNLICWKKINTINSIKKDDKRKNFIIQNLEKLLYDISKALTVLHQKGKVHGDCRLDNIGFLNNFMLFDFDSMVNVTQLEKNYDYDYKTFLQSIEFHADLKIENINSIGSAILYAKKNKNMTYEQAHNYLETLNIITDEWDI